MTQGRCQAAIAACDKANVEGANKEASEGKVYPRELLRDKLAWFHPKQPQNTTQTHAVQ